MRPALASLTGLLLLVAFAFPAPAAELSNMKGLWLITDYPAMTVRAGETATIKLKLQNANLPPEQVALSATGVPEGWKAEFLGGGQPVAAAMAAPNETVSLDFRVEVPADAKTTTQNVVLHAKGANLNADLPLRLALGGSDLPAKLTLKTKLPSLVGSAKSSFEYTVTVGNDSGKSLVVSLGAEAPPNFQTSFTENYGSQEITSIPIDAGQTKDLKVKVQPPGDVQAGNYNVNVHVSAEGASAQTQVAMQVTGQPKLRLAGKDGRLSGQAEAGSQSTFTLSLTNDGSAPAEDVELNSTPPSDWKVEFNPKKIDRIAANQTVDVQALITPAAKAIAGDYMTSLRANAKGDSSTADFRVTVTTSTLWGVIGIAVIAIALLVVVGAVARFGRR
jgi:uncharacterized membrane protein